MIKLLEISKSILLEHDFGKYVTITKRGVAYGVQCTYCKAQAPLGVPISHNGDCGKESKE